MKGHISLSAVDLEGQVRLLNDALESTSQAFVVAYPDGRFRMCNTAFCDLTGYSRKEIINGLTWSIGLTPPEWREPEARALAELNRTGAPQRYEKEYVRKDGTRVPIELFVHRALDHQGLVSFYYTFITDIAERKSSETAYKKYHDIFDVIQDIILVISLDGKIMDVNEAAIKAYGYTRDEMLSMHLKEVRAPGYREGIPGLLKRCFKQGCTFETVHQRKGGGTFTVEVNTRGFIVDGRKVVVGIGRDITERKLIENKLAHIASFPELNPLPIIEVDNSGGISYANPAARELFPDLSHSGFDHPFLRGIRFNAISGNDITDLKRDVRIDEKVYQQSILYLPGTNTIRIYSLDITDRKRAEEALRKNERMLRQIIDSSPVPMSLYNEVTHEYYHNNKFIETFGYSIEEVPTINEWWTHAYPDEEYRESVKKRWYAAVEDAIKHQTSIVPMEVEVTCKDGSTRTIVNEFASVGDINLSVLYDITDMKLMEAALQETLANSERHAGELDALVTSIADALMVIENDGSIRYMNEEACRIFGYSPDDYDKPLDIRTAQLRACYPDGTPLKTEDMLAYRALHGETVNNIEMVFNRKDTGPIWIIASAAPVRDRNGGISGAVITLIDNTKRRQTEDALRESEERFKAYMDNSQAIAWMKNAIGEYVYVNKTYEDKFEIRANDRVGRTDFDLWPREVAEQLRKNDLEVLVSNRATHVVEETPDRNGNVRYWLSIKFPFRDAAGNMFVGGIGVDITGQKQAEEALKAAKGRNELYVDLMGHDINNMNQVAMGYLELAADSLDLNNDKKELLHKPLEALKNSTNLIENVQKLKKLESGGFRAEVIDINDVLTEIQNQYSGDVDKRVRINYRPSPGCKVMANGLLKDVFSNLIGNAIKHSSGNDVTINVRLVQAFQNNKMHYQVTVDDNGPGIPDELKSRIFNRFEQGNTKARGKGLGLYLVKTLVHDFHGKVRVEDRVEGDRTQGSRFVVTLPAYENGATADNGDKPRVAIVEDDIRIMELYKKILARNNIIVNYMAVSGIEAVDLIKNAKPRPNIILMDHRLPGKTGLDATMEIKSIDPNIKVIMISADAAVEQEAKKVGVTRFLHKPAKPKDILKAITDLS